MDVQRELYNAQIDQVSSQAKHAAAAVEVFISLAGLGQSKELMLLAEAGHALL